MNKKQKQNVQDFKKYDDDSAWSSFIEIISSGIKVGIFCICIYILKEICVMAYDLFFVVSMQDADVIMLVLVPFLIIVFLGIGAFWLITH